MTNPRPTPHGGQAALRETRFENARLAALGLEPMTLADLRRRAPDGLLSQPERVDFFMILMVTGGRGVHTVDFVDWPLADRTLILVRPGQVQQWHPSDRVAAQIVLVSPAALPDRSGLVLPLEVERLALDEWPTCSVLQAADARDAVDDLHRLGRDFERFDGGELHVSLIRHQLMILLLRLANSLRSRAVTEAPGSGFRATHRLFTRELETRFAEQHGVQYYARRLGYAESTLSRACHAVEGRSAKQVIDRRIALEAQRLLAHSAASVAEIAHALGFSEATNFVKFFRRTVGRTPSAFREALRPDGGSGHRRASGPG